MSESFNFRVIFPFKQWHKGRYESVFMNHVTVYESRYNICLYGNHINVDRKYIRSVSSLFINSQIKDTSLNMIKFSGKSYLRILWSTISKLVYIYFYFNKKGISSNALVSSVHQKHFLLG